MRTVLLDLLDINQHIQDLESKEESPKTQKELDDKRAIRDIISFGYDKNDIIGVKIYPQNSRQDKSGIDAKIILKDGIEKKIQITTHLFQQTFEERSHKNKSPHYSDASGKSIMLREDIAESLISLMSEFCITQRNIKKESPSNSCNHSNLISKFSKLILGLVKHFNKEQCEKLRSIVVTSAQKELSGIKFICLLYDNFPEFNNNEEQDQFTDSERHVLERVSGIIISEFLKKYLDLSSKKGERAKLKNILDTETIFAPHPPEEFLFWKEIFSCPKKLEDQSRHQSDEGLKVKREDFEIDKYDHVRDYIKGEFFNFDYYKEGHAQFPRNNLIYGSPKYEYLDKMKAKIEIKSKNNIQHDKNGKPSIKADILILHCSDTWESMSVRMLEEFKDGLKEMCTEEVLGSFEQLYINCHYLLYHCRKNAVSSCSHFFYEKTQNEAKI